MGYRKNYHPFGSSSQKLNIMENSYHMFFTTNKIVIMLFTGQARFILTLYHVCFFLYFNIHSFSTNRGFRANVMRIGNSYLDSVHLKNPRLVRNECSVCCIWYVKYGLSHSVCNIPYVT